VGFLHHNLTPSKTPLAGLLWSIESAGLAKTLGKGTGLTKPAEMPGDEDGQQVGPSQSHG